jgi:prophage regulatory protein
MLSNYAPVQGLDPMLRKPAVLAMTGISDPTLWRLRRRGEFPAPTRIGARAIGWPKSTVESWLASRAIGAASVA